LRLLGALLFLRSEWRSLYALLGLLLLLLGPDRRLCGLAYLTVRLLWPCRLNMLLLLLCLLLCPLDMLLLLLLWFGRWLAEEVPVAAAWVVADCAPTAVGVPAAQAPLEHVAAAEPIVGEPDVLAALAHATGHRLSLDDRPCPPAPALK
jgi:hypothetical protein